MDETLFNKVVESNPDLNKEASLNNAVAQYLSALELVKKEYPSSPDDAIDEAIRGFLKAKRIVLPELAGVFTRAELVGLLDAFNGTMIQGISIPPRSLLTAQMEDAEAFNNAGQWHGYNTAELLKKIEELTPIQAQIWLHEIVTFWQENKDLEAFLSQYQAK